MKLFQFVADLALDVFNEKTFNYFASFFASFLIFLNNNRTRMKSNGINERESHAIEFQFLEYFGIVTNHEFVYS